MSSHSVRRTHNALLGTGTVLLFYGVVGILYAEVLRSDATPCRDGGLALVGGTCYAVWLLLLPLVLAGGALLLGGLLGARWHREEPTDELYLSGAVHALTWLLTSFVVLPLLMLGIQAYRQRLLDTVFTIDLVGVPFKHTFLLLMLLLAALLAWVPYMTLLVVRFVRWRLFLARYEAHAREP